MRNYLDNQEVRSLIQTWVDACSKENLVSFKRYNTCKKYLEIRDKIARLGEYDRLFFGTGIEFIPEVRTADANLLRYILDEGVEDRNFDGEYTSVWWRHLDKISARTYPAQYFFDYPYLKEVYLKSIEKLIEKIPLKEDKDLIDEWIRCTNEDDFYLIPALEHKQAYVYLSIRDEIYKRSLDLNPLVVESDKRLIKISLRMMDLYKEGSVGLYFYGENKELKYWWWHCDKILIQTYPAELMPDHLRETYLYEIYIEDWEEVVYDEERLAEVCTDEYESIDLVLRDVIREKGLDNHPRVVEADKAFFKYVLEHTCYEPLGAESEDLRHWWWHIDKIFQGTYPSELLPPHLKEMYLKHKKNKV